MHDGNEAASTRQPAFITREEYVLGRQARRHPWARVVGARFLEDVGHTGSPEAHDRQVGGLPGVH